jgi:hypothetical protein
VGAWFGSSLGKVFKMSADNGIYVARFKDGYRVIHAQAINNLRYFDKDGDCPDDFRHREEWRTYFGNASVFPTKEDALIAAYKMAEEYSILEYGINYLGDGVEWRKK